MISVYSDGSSSGRSNQPGGYGWVVLLDGEPVRAGYGGDPSTTNNRMEMQGAISGLEAIRALFGGADRQASVAAYKPRPSHDGDRLVELVSDSQYTLYVANGRFSPTKNLDLAAKLRHLYQTLGVQGRWVRGHSGDVWNERADSLAKMGKLEAQKEALDG